MSNKAGDFQAAKAGSDFDIFIESDISPSDTVGAGPKRQQFLNFPKLRPIMEPDVIDEIGVEAKTPETKSKGLARVEIFTDGVFAIAITLLVLDIHVPVVKGNVSLLQALLHDWETYLAFLIGFFTLLVCWINHLYMFEFIGRMNDKLLLLNGFKLLVVSFTPFATALLSHYISTNQQQTAITIYAFNFFLMGLAMTSIWLYALKKGLISQTSAPVLKASTTLYILASVLSGTIFILSFFTIWVCLPLFVLMFLIFVFPANVVAFLVKRMSRRSHSTVKSKLVHSA